MKSVERHIADVLELVEPLDPIELDLLRAHGAVLAEPVTSAVSLPAFDNSAMDGYAVVADDVAAAAPDRPVTLPVVADIPAGDPGAHAIRPGMCARIMTGAPMPAGATAVVPVEWTDAGVARVAVHRPARAGNAVRRAGEDVEAGTRVLRDGVRIGAAELAVLAAVGRRAVRVRPRPRVVVLSTGAELVEPGDPVGPGQIWESNSYMLAAAVLDAGCVAYRHGFVADDPAAVLGTLEDLLVRADLVLTTGGVSMGAYDVVKEALARLGTVRFEKVAMQPGMPQGFGTVGEPGTPIITLPGNPVSAFVSFHLFVLPVLRRLRGMPPEPLPSVPARLLVPVSSPPGRRSYLRAVLDYDRGDGGPGYAVRPAVRQGSHQLSALAETNALVVVPEEVTDVPAGGVVEVLQLPTGAA
ncbi:molybdotransferase-like divisome protein Glp [Marinitenerispora sediminis]|uniref:Molybdopterin molybdenumtransferase n=1 Tax=Marinitenerispora sediminis TaxID=1931232 RepID=A0A368TBC1_9ACTN|nr:gephyrin-like molybdotransferase Glp [Marinitenerispora sediminis]RCV57102.1 molybdopterin molybdenumtransferase MoeA [Marinitenerispora sediminis]RCV58904.1 molybdopterin molybdenumtransferase MoeA [Marinitenerispora sediminis]RCV62169.1 molybdopterin molybdenumtransferase MoeA [Marinitenerispora sediminis]